MGSKVAVASPDTGAAFDTDRHVPVHALDSQVAKFAEAGKVNEEHRTARAKYKLVEQETWLVAE